MDKFNERMEIFKKLPTYLQRKDIYDHVQEQRDVKELEEMMNIYMQTACESRAQFISDMFHWLNHCRHLQDIKLLRKDYI